MIRKNLMKAVMLGLCVASLSTGNAFAMATESIAPEVRTLMEKEATTAEDAELADDSGLAAEDEKLEIQIESIGSPDDNAIDEVTTVSAPISKEVRTISETVDKKEGVSVPVMILLIAGAAVLVGGTVILSLKKKSTK